MTETTQPEAFTPDQETEYLGLGNATFLTDDNADGIICRHCDCSWDWELCDEQGRSAFFQAGQHYRADHA